MRLLVTGAGGQLGHDVVAAATAAGDDVAAACDHARLDVTDRDAVLGAITTWRPDAVVHCAAWTAVDACEGEPGAGVHGQRPRRALGRRGVRPRRRPPRPRVDGLRVRRHARPAVRRVGRDRPDVGLRRVEAGGRARGARPRPASRRRAHVVGLRRARLEHGRHRAAAGARAGRARRARWRSSTTSAATRRSPPTSPRCCAGWRSTGAPGVIHATNQGAVSWYEFVGDVLAAAGYDRAMVRPITTAELDPPRPAPRPANSVLDNAVLRAAGIPLLRDYRAAARRARRPPAGLNAASCPSAPARSGGPARTVRGSGLEDRVLEGAGRQLATVADAELAEDRRQVGLDRARRDEQLGGDVAGRGAADDEAGDLQLVRREQAVGDDLARLSGRRRRGPPSRRGRRTTWRRSP